LFCAGFIVPRQSVVIRLVKANDLKHSKIIFKSGVILPMNKNRRCRKIGIRFTDEIWLKQLYAGRRHKPGH